MITVHDLDNERSVQWLPNQQILWDVVQWKISGTNMQLPNLDILFGAVVLIQTTTLCVTNATEKGVLNKAANVDKLPICSRFIPPGCLALTRPAFTLTSVERRYETDPLSTTTAHRKGER